MPWSVFCAHDEWVVPNGTLGDFNWIDMGRPKTQKDQLALIPYDGPRWYSRQATMWLMQKGQCTWDDIKLWAQGSIQDIIGEEEKVLDSMTMDQRFEL